LRAESQFLCLYDADDLAVETECIVCWSIDRLEFLNCTAFIAAQWLPGDERHDLPAGRLELTVNN
jgi:hypothetical protein